MLDMIAQPKISPSSSQLGIDELNEIFTPMTYEERIAHLYDFFSEEEVMVTSSFGTKSVFLLYLLHKIQPTQKIYFIDTTYHFPETLQYKEELIQRLQLKVIDVLPNERENKITREESWWIGHPKMCCSVNKVVPLEPIKAKHKIWISGLMSYQTEFRSHLRIFEQQGDIIKFHPIIDIEEGEFLYQMGVNQLPSHPLEELGFGSIGCVNCTQQGEGRSGRWKGTDKTECGLHPGYFLNRKKVKSA